MGVGIMNPQHFALYAIDTRTRQAYVVVGWRPGIGEAVPLLAPVDKPGPVQLAHGMRLVYGTEVPTGSAPDPDQTGVMTGPLSQYPGLAS